MAYTLEDFRQRIASAVQSRPAAAAAYRAGDPRFLAQLEAVAAMHFMLSQQIDLAEAEPFLKARDGTVLADAALKGILPLGRSARVQLLVTNPGTAPVVLAAGRGLLDGRGRRYEVEAPASIPPAAPAVAPATGMVPGTATVIAVQRTTRVVTHVVSNTQPFYSIEVPPSTDGLILAGLEVSSPGGAYTYTPDFANVAAGERIYHVETDEYRRVYIRFGASQGNVPVIGRQPANGEVITIRVTECEGPVELQAGADLGIEYVGSPAETELRLVLDEVLSEGQQPLNFAVLRMLSRYSALHDDNAVFLADFDQLLRKKLAGVEFLSVWNEQIEESVRGPDVLNINKLFVSYSIPSQLPAVSEQQITRVVARADDSYKVVFVARRDIEIPLTITAKVAAIHDTGDVEAQIRTALLTEYGRGSVAASQGLQKTFRVQRVIELLRTQVVALQDQISDFDMVVGETPLTPDPLPEDFRYLTPASLTVTVFRLESATGLWSV